ncbi:hypothetical protein [Qipengyuania soli]|uniref:Uncharacterized protein n=1 Tax=Qipengyuania soli TaxID=2782568 RepID=A0A7S8IUD3_9SPHN|nr:hypothetical protein [Qipengyuania soli]QPC98477.1 hypothetical protein IRL76_11595 [Qipengyuania soli]
MVLTHGRKRLILSGAAVLAALAVSLPLLPRLQTIAAPYTGVMRVVLPTYTRITLPGVGEGDVVDTTLADPQAIEDTAALAVEEASLAPQADAGSRPTVLPKIAPGNIIPVKFDIESPGLGDEVVGGDEIVVRKSVRLGSRDLGKLPIHVDSRSRLLIRPSDLRSVLANAGQEDKFREGSGSNELRTLGDLRKDGVDLRYDPTSDSVVLTIG